MNNRAGRLVLMIIAIILLAKDYRDAATVAPPPIIQLKPPEVPNISQPPSPQPALLSTRYATIAMVDMASEYIERNTKERIPFVKGKPIAWNLYFVNSGNQATKSYHEAGKILLGGDSAESGKQLSKE